MDDLVWLGCRGLAQETLGQNTDSVMSYFSPQIRFFAKTYTLTPYNGAEAHVSSSQLDFDILPFWVALPVSASLTKEPLPQAGGWVLHFPPEQLTAVSTRGPGLIQQVMLCALHWVLIKYMIMEKCYSFPLGQGECCSPFWQSGSHGHAGTGTEVGNAGHSVHQEQ